MLDTWFSSALWPFSTLGWPDDTADLRDFYPTTLMINGFDILFFWDARMIMTGLKFIPQEAMEARIPFRTLYIHALVRDAERQKMSKTRGNVLDPLVVTEEYGTDATRFTLAIMAAPGSDIALSADRLRSYRAFANKIWNAARFLFINLEKFEAAHGELPDVSPLAWRMALPLDLDLADRWIFSRLERATGVMNLALEGFRYHEAAHVIYHFFWHEFCDWYIEWVKPKLTDENLEVAKVAWRVLFAVFDEALRLLHPFMPFLTEELWHRLPGCAQLGSISLQDFPLSRPEWANYQAEQEMALVQDAIVALRNIRAEMKIDARHHVPGELATSDQAVLALFRGHRQAILRLANLSALDLSAGPLPAAGGVLRHAARFDAHITLTGADLAAELKRLRKEKEKLEKELDAMRARLADGQFRRKAPEEVVRGLEQRQAEYNSQYERVTKLLSTLESPGGPSA